MTRPAYFLTDGWAHGKPTSVPGMLQGGSLGALRTVSNAVQQAIVHLGTLAAFWLAWRDGISWVDVSALAVFYSMVGMGVSLGLHRLFSHQSFRPQPWLHALLAVLASMAMQGSPARWATDHQRHHACSDRTGDPHSPIVDPFGRPMSKWRGLYHAHWGWMFNGVVTDKAVYGQAIWGNRVLRLVSNTHYLWIALVLMLAWTWGKVLGGSDRAALSAMLWGACVPAFLLMHGVLSATSIAHCIGRQDFATGDASRNNWFVVLLTFGDGWHNTHHMFPRSARHGLLPGHIDIAGRLIELMEKLGLVSGVVRVPERLIQTSVSRGVSDAG